MINKVTNNLDLETESLPAYKNNSILLENRVKDLISRMTLEEKIAQMQGIWDLKKEMFFDENEKLDLSKLSNYLKDGIGQIGRLSDTVPNLGAVDMAKLANSLQKFFVDETRLGIPVIFHEECLHGLAGNEATSYPQPIGMASTFNPELIEKIYTAISEDARSRGAHQALTPVVDVAREPRWGRVEETFGEDPYLVAQMGIAAVKGLQGNGNFKDHKSVIATLKHFAAHGQPESGSNCGPANYSERVLRDTFLYPFKEVIQKANVCSIMPSYNEIDGVPSHANEWLLKDVLREEWGFKGFLVSDYYAILQLFNNEGTVGHFLAQDKKDAAFLAANAGVNIELPDSDCYPFLIELVNEGRLEESLIDELVTPLLEYKFRLGLFDNPYVNVEELDIELKLENDRPLALQAAKETITLLKNEYDLLPLHLKKNSTLAVIGPNADRIMLGGYSGVPKYYTTVLQGIKEKVSGDINVTYSEGCKITEGGSWNEDKITLPDPVENKILITEAVKTAKEADLVLLVLGDNEQTSREAWNKDHMGDRADLELFGMQNELAKSVLETGKPVVVILFSGRPNSMNFINDNVPAILQCWYLGQESGHAIADVVFGDYNPSGKLPISIPRSAGHIPCHYNHKPSSRRGYLFDDISALYPFGYGLSYTSFRFDNIELSKQEIGTNESTFIGIDVTNTGERYGTEVVQLYIRDLVSSVTRPVKELKGFKKVTLEPGETKTVLFEILPDHLAFTNINKEFTVEPGEFEIMLGNSSRSEDLKKIILKTI